MFVIAIVAVIVVAEEQFPNSRVVSFMLSGPFS
jgi:hypothetical protein